MIKFLISQGKLTFLGILVCVFVGCLLAYLSVEYVPWLWGKVFGLSIGLGIAALGGYSGRAAALGLSPPFTNDPLGWRKAKQSYQTEEPPKALVDEPPTDKP